MTKAIPLEVFVQGCTTTVEEVVNEVYDKMPDFCKDSSLSKQQNVSNYWKANEMTKATETVNCYNTYR